MDVVIVRKMTWRTQILALALHQDQYMKICTCFLVKTECLWYPVLQFSD